jgi:ferritin-like metal-binding protein YciE
MASISTQQELLVYELSAILHVEQELAETVLPKLIDEVQSPELRAGLSKHLEETRSHVTNIRRAFELLGEQPDTEKSPAFEGLVKSHEQLAKKIDGEHLADVVHATAAAKTEHFEIAVYRSLIALAESTGETELVPLLEENLDQEKQALEQVEQAAPRLTQAAV